MASGSRRSWWVLGALLFLTLGLRADHLASRPIWFDELWHLSVSNGRSSDFLRVPLNTYHQSLPSPIAPETAGPIHSIPSRVDGVLHPPLYHVLLRLWRELTGDSLAGLRGFSTLASMVVVALVFLTLRERAGLGPAAWASLLAAVSWANVQQSTEIRGYTLLQVWTLVTMIGVLKMVDRERPGPWPAVVAAGALAMMFTHYFAAGACAGIGAGVALLLRGRARAITLGALALAGVLWLVLWMPTLREQSKLIESTADIFLRDPSESPGLATLLRLLALPASVLVESDDATRKPWVIAGSIGWLLIIGAGVRRYDGGFERCVARLSLCVFVGAALLLAGFDLLRMTTHLGFPRYALLANPAMCMLVSFAALGLRRARAIFHGPPLLGLLACLLLTQLTPPFADNGSNLTARSLAPRLDDRPIWIVGGGAAASDAKVLLLHLWFETRSTHRGVMISNRRLTAAELGSLPRRTPITVVRAGRAEDEVDLGLDPSWLGPWRQLDAWTAIATLELPVDSSPPAS